MIYNLLTIGKDIVLCERCGERVEKTNGKKKVCSECAKEIRRLKRIEYNKTYYFKNK